MSAKADYARSQGQTREHHCHWPGCDKQVPPAMWGCKERSPMRLAAGIVQQET